jgi:putative spermidine/putrescine transport system ATP-binding protein
MDFRLRDITKSYDQQTVLKDISFTVAAGEFVSIIGPSGAGKTTVLKIIAGLEQQDYGTIDFAFPPDIDHPVILVFQDFLLFPTMTVFENIAFGLHSRKVHRAEISERVEHMLRYFQLQDRAHAYPAQLSGGQQQRVAIARGMVVNPAIMLLDEPFANLDRSLRMETAAFIRTTQQKFGITTIAVTHDLEEALAVSDSLGVILDGRLEQIADPKTVYFSPVNDNVAAFLGPMNMIPEKLFALLNISASPSHGILKVRPEGMELRADPKGPGTITAIRFSGPYQTCTVDVGGVMLTAYQKHDALRVGDRVSVLVDIGLAEGAACKT